MISTFEVTLNDKGRGYCLNVKHGDYKVDADGVINRPEYMRCILAILRDTANTVMGNTKLHEDLDNWIIQEERKYENE